MGFDAGMGLFWAWDCDLKAAGARIMWSWLVEEMNGVCM